MILIHRMIGRGYPKEYLFPSAQTVRPAISQGLLGPYPLLQHAMPVPRQPGKNIAFVLLLNIFFSDLLMSFTFWKVEEMSPCPGKQLHPPLLSSEGSWSLLGSTPVGVPPKIPRMAFRPKHHHESRGAFLNKVSAFCLHIARVIWLH